MALRPAFLLLFLAVAFLARRSSAATGGILASDPTWAALARYDADDAADSGLENGSRTCNGLVGECIEDEEEEEMESETARRVLYGQARARYISYGALERNRVPCRQRGASYYNCRRRQRVNPYRRGCSRITNCARDLR